MSRPRPCWSPGTAVERSPAPAVRYRLPLGPPPQMKKGTSPVNHDTLTDLDRISLDRLKLAADVILAEGTDIGDALTAGARDLPRSRRARPPPARQAGAGQLRWQVVI